MTKTILQRHIYIDKDPADGKLSGKLILETSETLNLKKIVGKIYLEARGKMNGKKDKLLSFHVQDKKRIIKNVSYEIPFVFSTSNLKRPSYRGKNVSLSYSCEIRLFIDDQDFEKLEKSFALRLKSLVSSENSVKVTRYFEVYRPIKKYILSETESDFLLNKNWFISILTGIIAGLAYIAIVPEFSGGFLFIGFLLILGLSHFASLVVGILLGKISMKTEHHVDYFLCTIFAKRKFSFSNKKIYFQITEKVIDDRGTTSTTHEATLYTSEKKEITNIKNHQILKFNHPTSRLLEPFAYKNIWVNWEVIFEIETLGLKLKYSCPLKLDNKGRR